jgi:hypothetical protein
LSLAARHLAYRDIALGVLPLGTTNNFARTLGIPLNVAAAVGVPASGKVADVDLGRADGTFFANLVSVGLPGPSPPPSGTISSACPPGPPTRSPRWPGCPGTARSRRPPPATGDAP